MFSGVIGFILGMVLGGAAVLIISVMTIENDQVINCELDDIKWNGDAW